MCKLNRPSVKQLLFDAFNFAILLAMLFSLFVHLSEEQLLNLPRNVLLFCSLVLIGVIFSLLLSSQKIESLGAKLFSVLSSTTSHRPLFNSFWGWQLIITLTTAMLVGGRQTEFSLFEIFDQDGFSSAQNLFLGLLKPDWSILPVAVLKVIETIFIALMATALAVPIAFVLAFFSAKNIMTTPAAFTLYSVIRVLFNITRSVEPIIWVVIFAVWVGIGPFAGMLALMMQSIASLTKQYSELIESVHPGPIESIAATGANRIQTIWFGIVPQVLLPYISFTIYRWDTNVRMATIIGFAGGGGIGTILYQYSMRAQWAQVSCLILVIAAIVWVLDVASAYLRDALK